MIRIRNIRNKILSGILALQILITTVMPVVANAVTIEFPVKITEKQIQTMNGVQVISGNETATIETEISTKTIKDVDWKTLSNQELADVICATPEKDLSEFLKKLKDQETEEILNKPTSLINPVTIAIPTGKTYIDETGETWPVIMQNTTNERYYDYLMKREEENSINLLSWGDGVGSSSDIGSGRFTLKITKDGKVETQITFAVSNVTQTNQTLSSSKYTITVTKNNSGWETNAIKIENDESGGHRTWSGIVVQGKYNKPEHYYTTWELENKSVWQTMLGGSGRFSTHNVDWTDSLEHRHTAALKDSVRIQCNSRNCGLSKYSSFSSITGTIEMKRFKESIVINPNGGTHEGNTSTYTLVTKKCMETTTIAIPTRPGYRFTGWTVSHGTGASGTLNGSTYTHCISDAGWNSEKDRANDDGYWGVYTRTTATTTLTANWVVDTLDVQGNVTWIDTNNKYSSRPSEATINLYRDGSKTSSTTTLNTYAFRNLVLYNPTSGKSYKYTITQEQIPGYETTYIGYNITNQLIVPTYSSTIKYTPINTFEGKYLKNGQIKVTGEVVANAENRDQVGLYKGQAIFQVDSGITINPNTINVTFYEARTNTTTKLTNYQLSGNIITATYGTDTNGISQKGDKIIFEAQGTATKIGKYTSTIKARGNLKDYRGANTNINLGEVTNSSASVTVEYQVPKAKIQITKKDSITEKNLQDATFTLYEWDGSQYVEKEIITDPDRDGIYTSQEYEWSHITGGKYKIKETGIPEYHKNLDFSMEYTINQLETSNYTITPEYSNGAYKIAYATRIPDDFDAITGVVENEPIKVKAKIEKVDAQTEKQIKADATFTIYEWDNTINKYKEYASYINNKKVKMQRQDDGTYLSEEWLYYTTTNDGKYRIVEEISPIGYYGDYKNQEQGLEKNTYDINIKQIVEQGVYKGQIVSNESILVISNQGETGTEKYLTNQRVKAEVYLQLIDSQTKTNIAQGDATLAQATYSIYAKENIYHADGTTTNYEGQEGLLYQKDELVQTLTTDANGKIVFEDLECGKYYIKQNEAPKGYLQSTIVYDVELSYQGEETSKITKEVTAELVVKKQAFQMYKLQNNQESTLDPLKDAGFSIYLISDLSIIKKGKIERNENGTYTLNDTTAQKDKRITQKANVDGTYDIIDLVNYFYRVQYEENQEVNWSSDGKAYNLYKMQSENYVKNYQNTSQGEYITEQKTR